VRHDDYLGGLVAVALQVFHELCGNRQVTGIEALDLFNAGAGILCERVDVDLTFRQDQPHANRRMTQAINPPSRLQDGVDFQPGLFHQLIKILRDDASRSGWSGTEAETDSLRRWHPGSVRKGAYKGRRHC